MLQCYGLTCGRSVTAFLAPPRSQRPEHGPRSPHPKAGPDGVLTEVMFMLDVVDRFATQNVIGKIQDLLEG
jgi:hypothetical protein